MNIKRGLVFKHTRWLEDDYKTPATYVITAVRKGIVYYKHRSEGIYKYRNSRKKYGKHSIAIEDFHTIVKEEIT